MNPNDDLNILGYTSSAPDIGFAPRDEPKAEDQADLPAIERGMKLLRDRKAYFASTDSLTLGSITVENQLIINKQMQSLIDELQTMLASTVLKVREKMKEQR